jgi:hypothetical protein
MKTRMCDIANIWWISAFCTSILHALKHNQLQEPIFRNMIWHAAKVITPWNYLQCKSSCIPGWIENCKMLVLAAITQMFVESHILVFIAFVMSAIQDPASLSPQSDVFHTITAMSKPLLLWNISVFTLTNQLCSSLSRLWNNKEKKIMQSLKTLN